MNNNELTQMKEDMEVIKEAMGLELPFGWDTVFVSLVLLPAAGLWCLFYLLISDQPSRLWAAIPLVVPFAAMGYLRFKYRRSTGRSAIKRREYGFNFYGSIVLGTISAGYFIWAIRVGLDIVYLAGGLFLICGIMATFMAFQTRGRLHDLGGAIPLILLGASTFIWPTRDALVVSACITLIVVGLATGAIQVYQLKRNEMRNDTD
ncbi:MAG: hypothetical protein GY845_38980 [Planctomycetes bacterium]|nr:hypothetical protein [Planctomycetota bacterium]